MKTFFVILLLVLLNTGMIYGLINWHESRFLQMNRIAEIEAILGEPYMICHEFPPVFGKALVTEKELESEFEIRVYLVRSFGQKYLIIKSKKNRGTTVIASRFEVS